MRPDDPIANKSILYVGPDGILSLGYTGLAFLEGIPTDQWLVEKMTGLFYRRGARPAVLRFGRLPRWLPVGRVFKELRDELDKLFALPDMQTSVRACPFFEVAGTGWQWTRRGLARPVLFGVVKKQVADRFEVDYGPRRMGRECFISATPDTNANLIDKLSLGARLKKCRSVDETEQLLVDTIRDVASQTPVVGVDCMSILLPPPSVGPARVRYLGTNEIAVQVVLPDGKTQSIKPPTAFSPWIVGSMAVHAPSVFNGDLTVNIGHRECYVEMPLLASQSAISSIERPHGTR
jgi:hypothetical protein